MTSLTDAKITGKVIAALGASPKVKETNIEVITRNGRVILTGTVDTLAEKLAAEEIVRRLPGVRAVENDLTVTTQGEISNSEVEENVLQELQKDKELQGVGVHVREGTVILKGKLPSLALEKRAIDAAASAKGVREVVSDIEIAPGYPIDDITIANSVTEALSDDPRLYLQDLDVRVHDGFVDIWGAAPTPYQASLAEEVAASVPGVKRVESHLTILESSPPWENMNYKNQRKRKAEG